MLESVLDVLLVEDNPADIEMTLDALKENHLANRVKILRDGQEAVDYIFRQGKYADSGLCDHPVLILLDLNLPKISGIEILKRIRADERTKNIPVVVLTSSPHDKDRIESYSLGVNSYIVKPVEFESFAHAVAQIGYYWVALNKPPF
jgi:two-component system, response regulator